MAVKRHTAISGYGNAELLEVLGSWSQGIAIRQGERFVFVNQAFAEMCGYDSPEAVLRLSSAILVVAEDDRERVSGYFGARVRGEDAPECYELKYVRRDGSFWFAEHLAQDVLWHGEPAVLSAVNDITQRRHDDDRLKENQQRFKDFAESAADWFWETDSQHRFKRFAGQSDRGDRDLGKTRFELRLPDDVDDENWRAHHADLAAHRPFRGFEFERNSADGTRQYIRVNGVPLFSNADEFLGYRGTASNITESKRRQRELEHAKDAAARANRAKSEFLSSMSHELRTPLNAILGFGQLLRDYSDDPLTAEQEAYLEQMLDGGQHLLGLVNEVLDLSKIESGDFDLSLEAVDPSAIIRESLRLVQPLADERGIAIINDADIESGLRVKADAGRLKQVLLNILSNAVKYNSDKGTASVNAAETHFAMLRINVSDTGPGIADEKRDEVFRPFSRLVAKASKIEGTGIGLTISRQLIESMGGRLDFDSTLGKGSTFWIDVPLAEPKAASSGDV